ncbi:hypothetical protein SAMN05661096_02861 [Marivirga sericea]|uniref:Uncharacterized protein n=1 Tax=Marivirga sericea TaxID=1028 RepID=A0A1X7KMZ3_9BACT|nr:hypothetical protein [Marivirga sericea]SMG42079.1 hypothetical protein SAMN05661096_02861 [Marivirga sericea]
MKYVFEGLIIIGIVALIVTIIKYPKDIGKGLLGTLSLPFRRLWTLIRFLLLPFELLILFLEHKFDVNYLTKFIDSESSSTKKQTTERKHINFKNFKKYVIINSTSEQIEEEVREADECCLELNLVELRISRTDTYTVIDVPQTGFYGYNFLIQWLTNSLKENQIVGFASNASFSFLTISSTEGENDMIGRTDTYKKFWVSLYDDLDNKEFLRINEKLDVNSQLTTVSLEKMVRNAM